MKVEPSSSISARSTTTATARGRPYRTCRPVGNPSNCTSVYSTHIAAHRTPENNNNNNNNKPVGELARARLNFKRPTRRHRTATAPNIHNFISLGCRVTSNASSPWAQSRMSWF